MTQVAVAKKTLAQDILFNWKSWRKWQDNGFLNLIRPRNLSFACFLVLRSFFLQILFILFILRVRSMVFLVLNKNIVGFVVFSIFSVSSIKSWGCLRTVRAFLPLLDIAYIVQTKVMDVTQFNQNVGFFVGWMRVIILNQIKRVFGLEVFWGNW